jgi:hypothetical protein
MVYGIIFGQENLKAQGHSEVKVKEIYRFIFVNSEVIPLSNKENVAKT